MISQGFRPAGDPNFTPAKKRATRECVDCKQLIYTVGNKKRCSPCSSIVHSQGYKRKKAEEV